MIELILEVVVCVFLFLLSLNPIWMEDGILKRILLEITGRSYYLSRFHIFLFWNVTLPVIKTIFYLLGIEDTQGNDDGLLLSNFKSGLYKITSSLRGKRSMRKTFMLISTEIRTKFLRWKLENVLGLRHIKFNFHWFKGQSFEIDGVENAGIAAADACFEDDLIRFFSGFFRSTPIQQTWITCHEFSHILLEHCGERLCLKYGASQNGLDEREADTLGLILMRRLGYDISPLEECFTKEGCYNNPIPVEELNVMTAHFDEMRLDGYVPEEECRRFKEFEELVEELIPNFRQYMTW